MTKIKKPIPDTSVTRPVGLVQSLCLHIRHSNFDSTRRSENFVRYADRSIVLCEALEQVNKQVHSLVTQTLNPHSA